jgi:hypothetical protein
MQGWHLHAQYCGPQASPRLSEYFSFGICPRCASVVFLRKGDVAVSPHILDHEDWHHRTDYPHP